MSLSPVATGLARAATVAVRHAEIERITDRVDTNMTPSLTNRVVVEPKVEFAL